MIKCGLIVGHSEKKRGAYNKTFDVYEYDFNNIFVDYIIERINNKNMFVKFEDLDLIKITRNDVTYSELPDKVNSNDLDFAVSFHCNAFNTHASGCEVLYYHSSNVSKKIAEIFLEKIYMALQNKNRGIKSLEDDDRGAYLLRKVKCPIVILEPFFIDNDAEYINVRDKYNKLLYAVIDGIVEVGNLFNNTPDVLSEVEENISDIIGEFKF